jgi:hypothetical protein
MDCPSARAGPSSSSLLIRVNSVLQSYSISRLAFTTTRKIANHHRLHTFYGYRKIRQHFCEADTSLEDVMTVIIIHQRMIS